MVPIDFISLQNTMRRIPYQNTMRRGYIYTLLIKLYIKDNTWNIILFEILLQNW